ncbi:WXG100 family type VII secretion target [Micromonospora arida]|uniref:PPE family protein n=1 Tax=Micromonospora zamorensis TaxID=709883 RepID=A0ABZ1PHW4_9ACTN
MSGDDEKPNSFDTIKEQWKNSAEPDATFPPSDIPTSNLNDYQDWAQQPGGWRLLRAAVTGGAAMSTDAGRDRAAALVNPQSLMDAGAAFELAYRTLEELAKFVRAQARAVAGEERPWQGPAADAFLERMEYLATYFDAQAERIAGAAGTGSRLAIPQQLYDGAYALDYAQYAIKHWDREYARVARAAGNAIGADGLVSITGTPLEKPMAEAMAKEIEVLARHYQVTYESVVLPERDESLRGAGDKPPPSVAAPPPPDNRNVPPPNLGGGGGGGANLGAVPPPNRDAANLSAVPPPNVRGTGGGAGGGVGVNTPNLPPPNLSNLGGGPNSAGVNAPNIPPPIAPNLGRPNGTGVNSPNIPRPAGAGTGTGGLGVNPPSAPGGLAASGPSTSALRPPSMPNVGGIGSGVNVPGPPGAGNSGAPGGIPPAAPPGSPGGSGGGSGVPDRPDASGLLEGDESAWAPGGGPVVRPPDAGAFTPSGGAGLQSGAAGAGTGGMPMMPGSPGAGSPGGGAGVPDRPDAAGLVQGNVADWEAGAVDTVEGPAAPTGAAAGSGLGLDTAAGPAAAGGSGADAAKGGSDTAESGPSAAPAAPSGMPMMPGMPGGGAPGSPGGGGTGGVPDRPDASGLVTADGTEWAPAASAADITGSEGGTAVGGAGLTTDGPVVDAAAGPVPAVVPAPPTQPVAPAAPAAPAASAASAGRPAAAASIRQGSDHWTSASEGPAAEPESTEGAAAKPDPVAPTLPGATFGVVPAVDERERDKAMGAMPHLPGAGAPESAAAARPDAAVLLAEPGDTWGETGPAGAPDDVVPLLRLDDVDEDVAAWDDIDGSWLLAADPDHHDEPDKGRRTDG